jgi:lipopolysaccharide transport system ATP-binding protein
MSVVIKIENVSKQYRLGSIGTKTLKGDLQRWWYNIRGLPDPTLMIGQENVLSSSSHPTAAIHPEEFVWALRDINFEVKQGEILGIIGKNGAGKSTLLKLLSRVTAPTTGSIKVKGRIASLLEVGTGFHPDLTGRENIFLNGAILGMTKPEIRRKFDEIVDFSGCELYIDTPVKRYSSGMYVRLAFAVAAHLDSEILIVDEVLAVGDAEFQNKAIGKMQEVSHTNERTILFVSHNMAAVTNLCNSCLLLKYGRIEAYGKVMNILDDYLAITESGNIYEGFDSGKEIFIKKVILSFNNQRSINIDIKLKSRIDIVCSIDFRFKTKNGVPVGFGSFGAFNNVDLLHIKSGLNEFSFQISVENWALGKYFISLDITIPDKKYFERLENIIMFELVRKSENDRRVLDLDWNYGPHQINIVKR